MGLVGPMGSHPTHKTYKTHQTETPPGPPTGPGGAKFYSAYFTTSLPDSSSYFCPAGNTATRAS